MIESKFSKHVPPSIKTLSPNPEIESNEQHSGNPKRETFGVKKTVSTIPFVP
jgi:hypothetical protein